MADRIHEQLACSAVFVRVVQAASFSGAARALGITKSAVSKQIARLELLLGVQLLRRTTRSVGLTEAGREYYERVASAIDMLKEAQGVAADLGEKPRGLLRVTAPVTFGRRCVAPLLPEFLRAHPEIQLQIVLMDRPVDLAEEGFDVAVRIGHEMPLGVVARKLASFNYVLCGAAESWVTRKTLEDPSELADVECLRYGDGEVASTWQFVGADETRRVRVRGPLLVNNSELLRDAVLSGVGVALLPSFIAADDLNAERLVRLLPLWNPKPPFGISAHLIWLPARNLPLKTRAFIDFMIQRFALSRS